ncbi:hypothetical protein VFPBJ_04360 [Purpureocillium lilacinum]|uniref:Uncharacterized protein n=1 Tax=Purpureocillium lilacinum TaxID=33203 RepID=A0A179GV01_PURLI|nr:hypothetical protein VFPBJ_04360 [Purpureocillium lilacinum]
MLTRVGGRLVRYRASCVVKARLCQPRRQASSCWGRDLEVGLVCRQDRAGRNCRFGIGLLLGLARRP